MVAKYYQSSAIYREIARICSVFACNEGISRAVWRLVYKIKLLMLLSLVALLIQCYLIRSCPIP